MNQKESDGPGKLHSGEE